MTCLRLFMNSKMGKTAKLVCKKLEINGKQTNTYDKLNCSENELYNFIIQSVEFIGLNVWVCIYNSYKYVKQKL